MIENFKKKSILVIGDSILDLNTYLTTLGFSLETPTPKYKKTGEDFSYGGAANVVENILELNASCTFRTLLGDDNYFEYYNSLKNSTQRLHFFPIVEKGRQTTVKHRFWAEKSSSKYKIMQVDSLDNMEIGKEQKQKILEFANDCYTQDAVLLVDYRHGIFSKELIGDLKKITKEKHKTTIASSQVSESKSNHMDYSGVDLICLNSKEANEVLVKFKTDNNFDLENLLDSDICITSGEKGSALYMNKEEYQVNGIKVDEIDSCGAGDSFLAALSLCDYKGHPEESLYLANIWAGLSVTKLGTKIPKKQELIDYINNLK